MEARAIARYVRSSPRKMRLVVDLIRGKSAAEALTLLRLTNKRASKTAEMALRSAIANLQAKADNPYLSPESIVVAKIYVDNGPMLKRIQPAPMGRAYRVRKRSHHLTIVVATKE
ncbi:MAG: 50S ribosomal protein L22 [Chlorobi bacterium]|nr:50S ribosomal protein L22 [Chlorobiota bacterium]